MLYRHILDDSIESPTLILTADHSTSSSLGQVCNASSPSSTSHSSWSSISSTLRELCFFFCVLSANDRKWSIIALTFCGLFLPFTASKLCLWMYFPEHMHAVSLVFHYSAFPSSQIPHKTLCSLSNSCFSFPFFSSHSSSVNDLNVLRIFFTRLSSTIYLLQKVWTLALSSMILISFFL